MTALADEAIKLGDESGKAAVFLVHGHQGSIESQKYAWFSRFFVRIFKGIEPLAKITGLYGHSSATKSQIAKDYERTFYLWAKKRKVILMCGHSHRAIFASRSYADTLLDKIAELEAENTLSRTSKSTRRANYREVDRLRIEWEDERDKGRIIERIEPDGDPLPCYFNSGCGLYTDGITAIEIGNDEIKLVKWSNDTIVGPEYEVFSSGNLSTFIKAVVG